MKVNIFKQKSKRTKLFFAITILALLALFAINQLLYHFGLYRAHYFDMTPEGLYSLSEAMVEECDEIFDELRNENPDKKTKIRVTFCTDPDYLMASESSRLTYFMALKMQREYPDLFEVKEVNARLYPTSLAQYKTSSLQNIDSDDVIVSYGDRYRIVSTNYFWTEGTDNDLYYNGEYRLASLIKSVSAISRPVAYFVIDHEEDYFDPTKPDRKENESLSAFASLLGERGLEIKTLNLSSVEKIPEDCALLIINNPKIDFTYDSAELDSLAYISDTEKLDRYLVMRQGAIMVAKDYRISLPVFENFLFEWGFDFSESVVVDRDSSLADEENTGTNIIASYDPDPDSYGYAIYGEYANLASAPSTIFKDAGSIGCSFDDSIASAEPGTGYVSRNYVSFLTTSPTAQKYMRDPVTDDITSYIDGVEGVMDLAALSIRNELNHYDATRKLSYIFCVNSPSFLGNGVLAEGSYANYEVVASVVENISRVDEYASLDLGGLSLNSESGGGKYLIPTEMTELGDIIYDHNIPKKENLIKENHGISSTAKVAYTCVIMAVPLSLAVLGIVVCLKRRYL